MKVASHTNALSQLGNLILDSSESAFLCVHPRPIISLIWSPRVAPATTATPPASGFSPVTVRRARGRSAIREPPDADDSSVTEPASIWNTIFVTLPRPRAWAKTVSALPALCFVLLLTGCWQQQPSWHLNARKEGDTVQLCLSNKETCPQVDGISLGDISVYRYDSVANNEPIWETSPESPIANQTISGIVAYGIPPTNWRNKMTPPALVCGKAYLVNPAAVFFALKCDGTVVVFDFQHLEEFFRPTALPAPTKK